MTTAKLVEAVVERYLRQRGSERVEVPIEEAASFDCRRNVKRHPPEAKRNGVRLYDGRGGLL